MGKRQIISDFIHNENTNSGFLIDNSLFDQLFNRKAISYIWWERKMISDFMNNENTKKISHFCLVSYDKNSNKNKYTQIVER